MIAANQSILHINLLNVCQKNWEVFEIEPYGGNAIIAVRSEVICITSAQSIQKSTLTPLIYQCLPTL